MNGLFFTGTDTGVGKTFVLASVVRLLRRQGRPFHVLKPVATGANPVSEDTDRLADAAGLKGADRARLTRWSWPHPVAPSVAARLEGVSITVAAIAAEVRGNWRPGEVVLVEGVGGLLCPLTDEGTVADLAAQLGLPLIVVARRSLGTLNHTLLTLEVARARGLTVAGVVVNETAPVQDLADRTNVEELGRWIGAPVLAVVPFQADGSDDAPACRAALADVDWWGLSQDKTRL